MYCYSETGVMSEGSVYIVIVRLERGVRGVCVLL